MLTKSGYLEYRSCSKAYWFKVNRPGEIVWPPPDAFARMLMEGGYEVERLAREWVGSWPNAENCAFQVTYRTESLEARADLVRHYEDGTIDLFEIKGSSSIRGSTGDHVEDAAFQTAVIERAGTAVRAIHIIHVNSDYERRGDLDPAALLLIVDVTGEVRERLEKVCTSIDEALAFLALEEIDEQGCECVHVGNRDRHCPTFTRFNPGIPELSAYILPRISRQKLEKFHTEGRLGLDRIDIGELTAIQGLVHRSAVTGQPVVDREGIRQFIDGLVWPLHFYDYETFGAAIPLADGHRPHQQIPVQFSLHRLSENGELEHFEFLADRPGMEAALVDRLEACVIKEGNLISWNMPFEKGCNTRMAAILPGKADFLAAINEGTRDLEDPFKQHYVDARFGGSTSIKKVLPVLVPALAYSEVEVHDGTGAMQAWLQLTGSDDDFERSELRRQLLAYCRLDTLAMVEIFRVLLREAF